MKEEKQQPIPQNYKQLKIKYYEQLPAYKLGKLEKWTSFQKCTIPSKLSEEGTDNLSRTIIRGERIYH